MPIRVHLAALVIAEDPANADLGTAQVVEERATSAGHAIVAREVVGDAEGVIREQLARWIADPNIDVVIVTGQSASASAALRPLISETLPGFTDLFRWLAYQEIGAAAMLSNAEAAQCDTTFVFVLPAAVATVTTAMDKLVIPQLDARTTPQNLVSRMPRLKGEAVPVAVVVEKTAAGAGPPPRQPARRTGRNILRKGDDVGFDEGRTKPIDLERLQREIAASSVNDAVTRPNIDLAKLMPRVPPGADDQLDVGDDTDVNTPVAPPAPPAPAPPPATRPPPPSTKPPPPATTPPPPATKPPPPAPAPEPPPPRAIATDELPRGTISAPVRRPARAKRIATALLLSLAAAAAGVAIAHFVFEDPQPDGPPPAPPPAPPPPKLVVVEPPDASPQEIEIDMPEPPGDAAVKPVARPARPTVRPVATLDAGSTVAATPAVDAAVAAEPAEADCDEVNCVLEHYARACCERFRPAGGGHDVLDRVMVKAGVEKVKPRVIACGEKIAAKGTVKLAISVGGDGGVTEVTVVDTPDPALGECVATALRAAHFAKTTNGGSFTFPFVF